MVYSHLFQNFHFSRIINGPRALTVMTNNESFNPLFFCYADVSLSLEYMSDVKNLAPEILVFRDRQGSSDVDVKSYHFFSLCSFNYGQRLGNCVILFKSLNTLS